MSTEGSPCREYMNLKRFILPRVDCYLLLNFYSALSEMCLILTNTSRYVVHCSDNMCSCITVKSFGLFTNTQHWQPWHNIANKFPFFAIFFFICTVWCYWCEIRFSGYKWITFQSSRLHWSSSLVTTYVRSMWETICDARASRKWQGKICAQIGKNILFWDLVQNTLSHPLWKLKFRQILALWVLTGTEHPRLKIEI